MRDERKEKVVSMSKDASDLGTKFLFQKMIIFHHLNSSFVCKNDAALHTQMPHRINYAMQYPSCAFIDGNTC